MNCLVYWDQTNGFTGMHRSHRGFNDTYGLNFQQLISAAPNVNDVSDYIRCDVWCQTIKGKEMIIPDDNMMNYFET